MLVTVVSLPLRWYYSFVGYKSPQPNNHNREKDMEKEKRDCRWDNMKHNSGRQRTPSGREDFLIDHRQYVVRPM